MNANRHIARSNAYQREVEKIAKSLYNAKRIVKDNVVKEYTPDDDVYLYNEVRKEIFGGEKND